MRPVINSKDWAQDFQNFLNSEEVTPPTEITQRIFAQVHKGLNPTAWAVFTKLALVQAIIGSATLFLCPQFGISFFSGMGLMSIFMRLGETACMAACGGLFLGAGALVSSLVLRPEEVKVFRRNKFLQLAFLGTVSIGAFVFLGASVVVTLGLAWLTGSILGGMATLEFGWFIRSKFRRKLIYGI